MLNALFSAGTGMEAQQLRIAVISNNIANMSTSGFKQSRAVFQDLVYQTHQEPGAATADGSALPSGLQVGTGVKVVSTPIVFSQGVMEQTARDLDVAIEGDGFFEVEIPGAGTAYTRAGSLSINSTGELVTQQGFVIQPPPGSLSGVTNITINSDGTISGVQPGAQAASQIGNLQIATFTNPAGLRQMGKNLYGETEASGSATIGAPAQNGAGTIRQGFLESSNVNIADELIKMVLAQRAFELNSKVVRTADDMMAAMNQMR
jgi:flagellar basal-body rod protein FlgG